MDVDQNEKKYTSKVHRFFDLVYRLLVINILTIIIGLPIVTFFPAIVASIATIKNNIDETGVIKPYFRNFATYFWASFKLGLTLLIVISLIGYAFFFWIFQEFGNDKMEWIAQASIIVMIICAIVFMFATVHLPFIIITIPDINNFQKIKMSIFIAFRYILTTLILIIACVFILAPVILSLLHIIRYGFIGIWMIIGISLPLFLAIKLSAPVYYKIEKIDFKKISQQVEEDLEDE